MKRGTLALLLLCWAGLHAAVFEPREFATPEHEQRYRTLIQELRCLVCQNQNLADSNAGLAADLRRETYNMISTGKSNEEIVEFMIARYGDFVLYRPPLKATTVLLWLGPFVLAVAGLAGLFHQLRKRHSPAAPVPLAQAEHDRLQALLHDGNGSGDR